MKSDNFHKSGKPNETFKRLFHRPLFLFGGSVLDAVYIAPLFPGRASLLLSPEGAARRPGIARREAI